MTDDSTKSKELNIGLRSKLDVSNKIASDCKEYLQQHREDEDEDKVSSPAVPANMAWDPVSRQLWLGVSRSLHCDASDSERSRDNHEELAVNCKFGLPIQLVRCCTVFWI